MLGRLGRLFLCRGGLRGFDRRDLAWNLHLASRGTSRLRRGRPAQWLARCWSRPGHGFQVDAAQDPRAPLRLLGHRRGRRYGRLLLNFGLFSRRDGGGLGGFRLQRRRFCLRRRLENRFWSRLDWKTALRRSGLFNRSFCNFCF